MSIVENIRSLCKKYKTSIPKLEKELGFGNGAIYNWDKNSPSIDKLQKVADHFNQSVEKVLYGFEISKFEQFLRIIVGQRSEDDVAKQSGVSSDILGSYLMGIRTEQPDLEFVEKIAAYNPYEVLVRREDLLEVAGYEAAASEPKTFTSSTPLTIAAHHDGEDWTEEELQDIEEFKELLKLKRQLKKNKE